MTIEPTILFGVGATKAGTTWLYRHLSAHPDCHLRSIKELHYFDALELGDFDRQIEVQRGRIDKLRQRIVESEGAFEEASVKLLDARELLGLLKQRAENIDDYRAYLTYGLQDQQLVADITPSYALLPAARLKAMARISSNTRFVYLMRDPVSRLWSHIRMVARRASKAADAVPEASFALLENVLRGVTSGMTDRGDYLGAITRLKAAIDPRHLLVMFMEDLMTPSGLSRLCAFLGIRTIKADFGHRVHAGQKLELPEEQLGRARSLLRPQYEFVARHYPDLPENWRRNMGEEVR